MNYQSSLKEKIKQLHDSKSEEQLLKEDTGILMANYLSEIEKLGITKKELAEKIKTSPSYLTQVFKGDKPLNFATLAKIQKALNIRFKVTMEPANYIAESSPYYINPNDPRHSYYMLDIDTTEKCPGKNAATLTIA